MSYLNVTYLKRPEGLTRKTSNLCLHSPSVYRTRWEEVMFFNNLEDLNRFPLVLIKVYLFSVFKGRGEECLVKE